MELKLKNSKLFLVFLNHGDWGLGIGDWGWGIGDWGLGPIPNPQSPIPNPQSPSFFLNNPFKYIYKLKVNNKCSTILFFINN